MGGPLVPPAVDPNEVRLVERPPTPDAYARLRDAVGWNEVDAAGVAEGLRATLFSVCFELYGETIGCGRVVGDGGIYFYLQDVIVTPEQQGRGYGRLIMGALMGFLDRTSRPGAFVGLMAAQGVAAFYERYGFVPRPEGRPGMYRVWE